MFFDARRGHVGLHDARELQLRHDEVDQHDNRRTPRIDHVVRNLTVERIAHAVQFAQAPERIVVIMAGIIGIIFLSS